MPEPTVSNTETNEVETLRALRTELLTRTATQKSRMTELEGEVLAANDRADKAVATMRAAVIDLPMKKLAAEVSPVPGLFLTELAKDYNIEANEDGTLSLFTKDGKPATWHDKPVEFTSNALYQFLVGTNGNAETERAKTFKVIMHYSGASGGVGRKVAPHSVSAPANEKKDSPVQFGLR